MCYEINEYLSILYVQPKEQNQSLKKESEASRSSAERDLRKLKRELSQRGRRHADKVSSLHSDFASEKAGLDSVFQLEIKLLKEDQAALEARLREEFEKEKVTWFHKM